MIFTYKAKLANGELFEGTMDAVDRYALARDLKSKGNIPLSIKQKSNPIFLSFSSLNSKIFSKIKIEEQIMFT